MPIDNFGKKHITSAQITQFDAALDTIINVLQTVTQNLTEEDRQRFGSVNEQNKLVVNSVRDYQQTQPVLASPDVNWPEFLLDFADRQFADARANRLQTAMRMLTDFKIVHDFDNYQDSLTDYAYAKYKSDTNTPGFTEKYKDIKQFFPNTGGGGISTGEKKE